MEQFFDLFANTGRWFRNSFRSYLLGKKEPLAAENTLKEKLLEGLLGLLIIIAIALLFLDMFGIV